MLNLAPESESIGVLPPQDLDAEDSVLGSILLDDKAISRVLDILAPEDFYRENNKQVFVAARNLFARGEPIDNVTVSAELEKLGVLERIGGRAHLALLQQAVPTAANAEHYARIVKDRSRDRALIKVGHEAIRLGLETSMASADKIAKAGEALLSVSMDSAATTVLPRDLAGPYLEALQRRQENPGKPPGVASGLMDLDRLTGGWEPGKLIILAGRAGMGKSALAVAFALHMARKERKPVAYFSLEMSATELFERMISAESGVSFQRQHTGLLGDSEEERIHGAIGPLSEAVIEIDDRGTMNEWEIASQAHRLAIKHSGLGMVIVDHLQITQSRDKTENRVQGLSCITGALKALAKSLQCPVIALSQLNRAVESRPDKRPQLSDLRDSGSLEQDSDQVILVFRESYYKAGGDPTTELHVAKNRNGESGVVKVGFDLPTMTFRNLDQRHGGSA